MPRKTFTVTVDGVQLGKRTSDSRTYTHALLASPEEAAAVIRREEETAAYLRAEVAKLRAALNAGKVKIRDRGFGRGDLDYSGKPSYNGYEIFFEGAGSATFWHSNSKGEVKGGSYGEPDGKYNRDRIYTAREFLEYRTNELIRVDEERAASCQAKIDAIKSGDFSSLGGSYVISWHTSGPLATKAQGSAAKGNTRRVTVVPVDAK